MGRVARYKKIKACDPYSKQNGGRINKDYIGVWGLGSDGRKPKKRSKTSENLRALKRKKRRDGGDRHSVDPHSFDTAPDGVDDFDLSDLVGSVKPQKSNEFKNESVILPSNNSTVYTKTAMPEQTIKEEQQLSRMLKIEEKEAEKKRKEMEKSLERLEGENRWQHKARVGKETGQAIKRERKNQSNSDRHQKKKEFMNNKRKRKKGANIFSQQQVDNTRGDYDDMDRSDAVDEQDTLVTGEAAAAAAASSQDVVVFGEQAERPPTFRQLPRGAKAKADVTKSKKPKLMQEEDVQAERNAMEKMRAKVQAQYAMVRKRRNGAFHL